MASSTKQTKVRAGTPGLDEILHGGFLKGHTAVIIGGPGSGKTILGLQFLAKAETGLYIGFEEREQELRRNAELLGINLSSAQLLDLSATGDRFFSEDTYTVFSSEEVEGEDLIDKIVAAINNQEFDRLVIDPLTELRSLLPDDFQFRRNISSLFNELLDREVTTVCTAQPANRRAEADLEFLGNTTLEVKRTTNRREIEVTKYRGSSSASGRHTLRIHSDTGARIYPKLVPGDHYRETGREPQPSGIEELDSLLHGGIEQGSITIISGPSGVGKTTTATHFLQVAGRRGSRGMAFLFEELRADYLFRTNSFGMDINELVDSDTLEIHEVESLTKSPDEFAQLVRNGVEDREVEFILVDGISGYQLGLRGDESKQELTRELHALCRYLKRMGVTVILVEEIKNITGEFSVTDQQISYLADNILFLQYFEVDGEIRKSIGVMKKRFGDFERTLRELSIGPDGLRVGEKLVGYQGLLTGTPERIADD